MGLLRLLNPLCGSVTAPRHRQARAAERTERMLREALAEVCAVRTAHSAVRTAEACAPVISDPEPVRWTQAHADAIMHAYRTGGDVDAAIAEAYESILVREQGMTRPPLAGDSFLTPGWDA